MKTIRLTLAASALVIAAAMPADAADLMIYDEPIMDMQMATSGWDGVYAGIQGGAYFSDAGIDAWTVQGVVGANLTPSEKFLVGVEAAIGPYGESGDWNFGGYLAARLGFTVDQLLLYGIVGGSVMDSNWDYLAGLGVEMMVMEDVSVRGQVATVGGDSGLATVGVLWHF